MTVALRPLPGALGAAVDLNLTDAGQRAAEQLQQALYRHRLLVFADQHLNHTDLLEVAGVFGTPDTDVDRAFAVGGFPGITVVSNIVEHGAHVGIYDGDDEEEWHADNSFRQQMTQATLLYSVITPEQGGETRFADTTRAYDDLPHDLQQQVDGLRAVHSIRQLGIRQADAKDGRSSIADGALGLTARAEHPLASLHPITGRRSLLLGTMVIEGIVGRSDEDSDRILVRLHAHATSDRYVYTHQWRRGDLVVWDNRALLHTASACDSSRHRRLLFRASVR